MQRIVGVPRMLRRREGKQAGRRTERCPKGSLVPGADLHDYPRARFMMGATTVRSMSKTTT
jgi:hypothetical protein